MYKQNEIPHYTPHLYLLIKSISTGRSVTKLLIKNLKYYIGKNFSWITYSIYIKIQNSRQVECFHKLKHEVNENLVKSTNFVRKDYKSRRVIIRKQD